MSDDTDLPTTNRPAGAKDAYSLAFSVDVEARTVRAHHLVVLDAEEHARVAESTPTTVAGDDGFVDVDDLGGRGAGGGAVHLGALRPLWPGRRL
jgi:hypothetical protein